MKKGFRLFTENLGDAVIPKTYRKSIHEYFNRAGFPQIPYYEFGLGVYLLFFISLLVDIALLRNSFFTNLTIQIKIGLSFFLVFMIFVLLNVLSAWLIKLYLDSLIYNRVKKIEEVFPEFLSELSLNLKAGLGLEKALENSMEREFGYLNDEILAVSKKVKLGRDVDAALREFSMKYDSDLIQETLELILISWKKGTKTPPVIDRIVENIEEIRFLKKKVVASVTSYKIFLSIVTIFITPAMFALAYHLINLIRSITNKIISASSGVNLPLMLKEVKVNDTHFMIFSVLAVIMITFCSTIIISIIKSGTIKEGYRQIAMYTGAAVLSYGFFMIVFEKFFLLFRI